LLIAENHLLPLIPFIGGYVISYPYLFLSSIYDNLRYYKIFTFFKFLTHVTPISSFTSTGLLFTSSTTSLFLILNFVSIRFKFTNESASSSSSSSAYSSKSSPSSSDKSSSSLSKSSYFYFINKYHSFTALTENSSSPSISSSTPYSDSSSPKIISQPPSSTNPYISLRMVPRMFYQLKLLVDSKNIKSILSSQDLI